MAEQSTSNEVLDLFLISKRGWPIKLQSNQCLDIGKDHHLKMLYILN